MPAFFLACRFMIWSSLHLVKSWSARNWTLFYPVWSQRPCDEKLPRKMPSWHVIWVSNIAGDIGWGSLISAGMAVIGWALTIAATSSTKESSSSWVSSYNPNSKSMASTMYRMVPICLPPTPPKRDAWGDWITIHIFTHIITLPLTLHLSQCASACAMTTWKNLKPIIS